jgi:hypothetical protein
MKSENLLHGHSSAALLLAFAAFWLCAPAAADTLDAKTLSGLVSGHTWKQENPNIASGGYRYWEWNADGSVCMREDAASCMDTGPWKLDGDSVCYELSWWGKSTGYNARCWRVADKGDGRYEMIPVDGVTTFRFTILK